MDESTECHDGPAGAPRRRRFTRRAAGVFALACTLVLALAGCAALPGAGAPPTGAASPPATPTSAHTALPGGAHDFAGAHTFSAAATPTRPAGPTGPAAAGAAPEATTAGTHTIPPGPAAPSVYVALGDSYSSGESNSPYLAGTDSGSDRCHRSTADAYPEVVQAALASTYPALSFHACSGATIGDLGARDGFGEPAQDSWLGPDAGLVTLTLGGNDVGFVNAMEYCALRLPWEASCEQHSGGAMDGAIAGIGPTLTAAYARIHAAAPHARVLVLGYPRLFPASPPASCGTGVPALSFTGSDMSWANAETAKLDAAIRQAATAAGVTYVDTSNAFTGHELCTAEPYLNRAIASLNIDVIVGSFHPTAQGQHALAAAVLAAYRAG